MTNFEYYIKGGRADEGLHKFFTKYPYKKRHGKGIDYYNKWLLEEHEEPILDDIEKEYLSNVIKPFRDRVTSISKDRDTKLGTSDVNYYIAIRIDNGRDFCFLPYFKSNRMYKNMEINRDYTLKELNL